MPATTDSPMSESTAEPGRVVIIALFVTGLVTAQLIAVKVLALPLPTSLPGVGSAVLVPAGVLAYALTFLASDCYAELYGRRPAQLVVNIAFVMNLVMLGLVWLAIGMPGSETGVDPDAFAAVLSPSTNIVAGSLIAYLVSQNWDVIAFHKLGEWTDGQYLWLRNIGSTASSQFIDTVLFIVLAFSLVPRLLGTGQPLPLMVLGQLILGQYLLKLLIALLDTPVVYAVVRTIRARRTRGTQPLIE